MYTKYNLAICIELTRLYGGLTNQVSGQDDLGIAQSPLLLFLKLSPDKFLYDVTCLVTLHDCLVTMNFD